MNAVEVTVRRGQQGVPVVALFFSRASGAPDAQMNTTSVAAFELLEDEEGNAIKTMPRIVQ